MTFARGLVAVLLLALAVRLIVVAATPGFRPVTDALDYDRHAVALVTHGSYPSSVLAPAGGPTAFRPPMFPLALAAVYEVNGVGSPIARQRAGRVMEAVLGTVTVALICLIALRLWGVTAALVSGVMAAVYPPLILIGSSLMSESLYIPLVLAALLAALAHRESPHRWRWALVAGVLIGLAALTRSNGVAVLVPLCLLVWTERPRLSRRALAAPALLAAAAAVTLVPWTVRNALVMHAFIPISTQSGYALAGTYNSPARANAQYPTLWEPPSWVPSMRSIFMDRTLREPGLSARLRSRAFDYMRAHPAYPLEVGFWNTARLLNLQGPGLERWEARFEAYNLRLAELSVYAFWLLGAVALAGAATGAARRAPAAFWACPAVIALSTVFILGLTRYRSPADPFLIMLGALALIAGASRVRQGHRQRSPSPSPSPPGV
jgi:4-amino-4-deoxy-L-arabinose transferase-like glycosyltransferase